MVSAIITCAGTGSRAGFGYNKLLKDIGGITPFEKTVCAFANTGLADEIIIVCSPEDEEIFKKKCAYRSINARFVHGSTTRFKSVLSGLNAAKGDVVLIHDGARPFVSERIIKDCIDSVKKFGTGVTAVPATDTICDTEEKDGERFIVSSSRKGKFLVQTPQGFKTEELKKAFSLVRENEEFTDESGIYTKYIGKCRIVKGDIANKKLTYAEDFAVYENAGGKIFAGTGFDLHLLVEGRKLILGGIEIPHTKGLLWTQCSPPQASETSADTSPIPTINTKEFQAWFCLKTLSIYSISRAISSLTCLPSFRRKSRSLQNTWIRYGQISPKRWGLTNARWA